VIPHSSSTTFVAKSFTVFSVLYFQRDILFFTYAFGANIQEEADGTESPNAATRFVNSNLSCPSWLTFRCLFQCTHHYQDQYLLYGPDLPRQPKRYCAIIASKCYVSLEALRATSAPAQSRLVKSEQQKSIRHRRQRPRLRNSSVCLFEVLGLSHFDASPRLIDSSTKPTSSNL